MCVSSMVGDHYAEKWRHNFPWIPTAIPFVPPGPISVLDFPGIPVSRAEFEALKRDVEEMKVLLARAIKYDQEHNEPECETESKMALLRRVAEAVGINMDDVIGKAAP